MKDGQLLFCLPYMSNKTATREYYSSSSLNITDGRAYCREAVQYFFRVYATDASTRKESADLEAILQTANESGKSYASRIVDATYRSGNIRTENENISFYAKYLLLEVRPIVKSLWLNNGITFSRVVTFARYEGDLKRAACYKTSVRTVFRTIAPTLNRSHVTSYICTTRRIQPATKRVVSFMEQTNRSSTYDVYYAEHFEDNLEVYQTSEPEDQEEIHDEPINTADITSTSDLSERKRTY